MRQSHPGKLNWRGQRFLFRTVSGVVAPERSGRASRGADTPKPIRTKQLLTRYVVQQLYEEARDCLFALCQILS